MSAKLYFRLILRYCSHRPQSLKKSDEIQKNILWITFGLREAVVDRFPETFLHAGLVHSTCLPYDVFSFEMKHSVLLYPHQSGYFLLIPTVKMTNGPGPPARPERRFLLYCL